MSIQIDQILLQALAVTASTVKVIGFRKETQHLHPVDAIALVSRYPGSWTYRPRPVGVKWIRMMQSEPPPWIECYRTAEAAVAGPWPGAMDKYESRARA